MLEEAKKDWLSMFTEEVYLVWKYESKRFRKIGMLLYALNKEYEQMKSNCSCCEDTSSVISTSNSSDVLTINSDDDDILNVPNCNSSKNIILSPDIFNNTYDESFNNEVEQISKIQDQYLGVKNKVEGRKEFQKTSRSKLLSLQRPKAQCNDINNSLTLIEGTPKAEQKHELKNSFFKSLKQSTRSDCFNESKNKLTDITNSSVNMQKYKMEKESEDMPEPLKKLKLEKGFESNKCEPNYVYSEKGVRGKDRKKLKGWSCEECANFYKELGLPEQKELQNKCSKHRSKFAPMPCTPEGFWDLTIKKKD